MAMLPAAFLLACAAQASSSDLVDAFTRPPAAARPDTIWYWRHEWHTRDGITADLEAMAKVGIGGVLIGFIGSNTVPLGSTTILSAEWRAMLGHAIAEARRLGLRVNLFNSPGWSSTGGPWIPPEHAMQRLAWAETRWSGPGRPTQPLAKPASPALDSPSVAREIRERCKGWYRDVAVLAFPTPATERSGPAAARVDCDGGPVDCAKVRDGNPHTQVAVPNPRPGEPVHLRFTHDAPAAPRSLTLIPRLSEGTLRTVIVSRSDDGSTWQEVRRCAITDRSGNPINLPLPVAAAARHWRIGLVSEAKGPASFGIAEADLTPGLRLEQWTAKAMFDRMGTHKPAFSPDAADDANAIIPRDRILDLSDRLRPDGTLDWEAPAGDWTIVRYGRVLTLALNGPATPAGTGLECDKLDPAAVDLHWNGYIAPLLADRDLDAGLGSIHIDSYEKYNQNWTQRLPEVFRRQRGYDPIPYLPAMTGRVVEDVATSERFLWDLRTTICDTMADAYYGRMAELCHRHGKQLSVEPYHQVQFDNVTVGGRGDLVVTEFWHGSWPGAYWFKLGASPAHVYGKRLVGAEAFTAPPAGGGDWSTDPWALKALGDAAYCHGINHFIFHVSNQQPWTHLAPGVAAQWGQHLERTNTWFPLAGGWMAYLARCQHLLQQGTFVADVLYHVGENVPNESREAGAGLPPGFDYDAISPEAIRTRLSPKDGRMAVPDGPDYAVLVLPEQDRFMTAAMAAKLRDLVRAGGTILGPRPLRSPTLAGQPGEDRALAAIVAELWGDLDGVRTTERRCGAGRVFWGQPLAKVLAAIGTQPDVLVTGNQGFSVKHIHRRTASEDIYFLADGTWPNRSAQDEVRTAEVSFRIAGRSPELWNPLTGERRAPVGVRTEGGRTIIPMAFGPRQSWFVVFRDRPADLPRLDEGNRQLQTAVATVTGPWTVTFDPARGGPADPVAFPSLDDWSQRPEPGIRHYAGMAVYRTALEAPATNDGGRRFLDLGTVKNLAAVRVNGTDCGTVWCAPWQVEITSAWRPGRNEIAITVANLWPNRMIGDELLPDDCTWTLGDKGTATLKAWPDWLTAGKPRPSGRFAFSTWKVWTRDAPLLPSGLLGPVRVLAGR